MRFLFSGYFPYFLDFSFLFFFGFLLLLLAHGTVHGINLTMSCFERTINRIVSYMDIERICLHMRFYCGDYFHNKTGLVNKTTNRRRICDDGSTPIILAAVTRLSTETIMRRRRINE